MAQADYNIGANPSGLNMRTEINQIFTAILTQNSGATPPATTEAGMRWCDTSDPNIYYEKIRNHTNDGWVSLYAYDVATKTINALANDTVKLTGDQTIAGVKTFSSSPIVPTPTADMQVSTKKYVDYLGALKAPLSSPVFTGTPTAPTASSVTNNNQVATTAFAQPRLVSGTNIKTVNGTSLLGSGDIVISATPTTTEVLTATAAASSGAVGTYAFMNINLNTQTDYNTGSTLAGSSLSYAGYRSASIFIGPTVPSGTWRCMGYANNEINISSSTTLWLRIS